MAYVKTVWETGDVITAAKLNNAEDGIEAASPITFTGETWAADNDDYVTSLCTPAELNAAISTGRPILFTLPALESKIDETVIRYDYSYISGSDRLAGYSPIIQIPDYKLAIYITDENVEAVLEYQGLG